MDWASPIPGYLANVALRSLALAGVAGASLWLLRVTSPAVRHAVWTLLAAAMLVMAVFEPVAPAVMLRVLQPPADAALAPRFEAPILTTIEPARAARMAAPPSAGPALSRAIAQPHRRLTWRQAAAAIYLAGVLACLAMLAWGYRVTVKLVRASRTLPWPEPPDVLESSWIAVPVTVGFRHPKILLPEGWREWPGGKLTAVIAHERAHVTRSDWAVAMLAAVNRCLFWFHPLAWWLERELSTLAEQAADDAVLLAAGSRAGYAETLLEMAAAVRADRGRMLKEAMAMAKTAEVRTRIERILDETRQIPQSLTRARWLAMAACGIPLVCLAATVQLAPQAAAPKTSAVPPVLRTTVAPPGVALNAAVAAAPAAWSAPPADAPPEDAPTAPLPAFQCTISASSQYPYAFRNAYFPISAVQTSDPVYPSEAMAAGIEGDAILRLVIANDGHVVSAGPLSGNRLLVEAAQQAVLKNLYAPSKSRWDGAPMEIETTIAIPFRLHPDSPGKTAPTLGSYRMAPYDVNTEGDVYVTDQSNARHLFAAGTNSAALAPTTRPTPAIAGSPRSVPVLINKTEPEYPIQQRAAGIQGAVVLAVTVTAEGRAGDVRVTRSLDPALDQDAVESVAKWKFIPGKQAGVPIDTPVSIEVNFRLNGPKLAMIPVVQPGGGPLNESVPANTTRAPVLVSAVVPAKSGQRGTVSLGVLVGSDGRIDALQIANSLGAAQDQKAMDALMQWRFLPAWQNGRPVDYWTSVDVTFQ